MVMFSTSITGSLTPPAGHVVVVPRVRSLRSNPHTLGYLYFIFTKTIGETTGVCGVTLIDRVQIQQCGVISE